jgi:hypothetical protein
MTLKSAEHTLCAARSRSLDGEGEDDPWIRTVVLNPGIRIQSSSMRDGPHAQRGPSYGRRTHEHRGPRRRGDFRSAVGHFGDRGGTSAAGYAALGPGQQTAGQRWPDRRLQSPRPCGLARAGFPQSDALSVAARQGIADSRRSRACSGKYSHLETGCCDGALTVRRLPGLA